MANKRIRLLTVAGDKSAEDRISNLPQPIIHHILSQLSGKDVIRTCLLSKSLLSAMTSFPSLDLDSSWFKQDKQTEYKFVDYVKHSIQRLNIAHTTLDKFRIRANLTIPAHARRIVKDIDFAITNHVKLLDIDFGSRRYSLPRSIRLASSITTLNLAGLKLVEFSDDMMVFLASLENLSISNCNGLRLFVLSSTRIKSVSLKSCPGLCIIKIQSPSLQRLIFTGKSLHGNPCRPRIDVSECRFLKLLWLADVIKDNWVGENIPRLLHLEELKLINCGFGLLTTICCQDLKKLQCKARTEKTRRTRLTVRANNLESLMLDGYDYNTIDIEFPRGLKHLSMSEPSIPHDRIRNLAHFISGLGSIELGYDSSCNLTRIEMNQQKCFKGRTEFQITVRIQNYDSLKVNLVPPAYVLKSTCPVEFTLCLDTDGVPMYHHSFITLWNWVASSFPKVEFLTLVCQSFKVLLCLEQLKAVSLSPMYDLKHVTIRLVDTWTSVSPEMIGCLLRTSPNIETLSTGLEAYEKSIKFYYGSRTGTKNDRKCCRRLSMRCWRHSLKKVELKNFDSDDEEKLIDYFLEKTTDLDEIIKY